MNKTTILIVEDEAIVASDLAGKLALLGYEVVATATRGDQAVELTRSLSPHLVLMDIQLKGRVDGIEAAHRIRECCNLPVIFLTAHSDTATLARAKLTDPFGYILKPFEERELNTQIELALYKHNAENELRRQRELLHVILNSIGDGVIATDMQGNVTFINPVAESLTGWPAAEAGNMPLDEVFCIEEQRSGRRLEPIAGRVLGEKRSLHLPDGIVLVARDGRRISVEDRACPIRDADGRIIGTVVTFQDVSDERAREEALQHSEHLLKKAQEIAQLGSWELDVDAGEISWSDEAFRIFGLEPGQFTPTYEHFLSIVHPDDRKKVDEAYSTSMQLGARDYNIIHRIIRPDGEIRDVQEKCEHYRDHSGRVIRSVGMVHDITEQKRTQEDLERSNRELEEFAYVASHDLQEPLRGIIGFLQLLQSRYGEQLDAKGLQFIERSVAAANRMQSLIRELLSLSRISSRPAVFAATDLNTVVSEVCESLHQHDRQKLPEITCDPLPNLPIDASLIRSLFQNLMVNAIKYNSSEKPSIAVSCLEEGNNYRISITDNGIGIAPRFHQRIFVVFQRLHTQREYSGTGMGLALCKKIVERHGGTIWVESSVGQGSTFHFTLPKSR